MSIANNGYKIQLDTILPGKYKSKRYIAFVKRKWPSNDVHHIHKKSNDYLLHPVISEYPRMSSHDYHLNVVEKHKAKFLTVYIQTSLVLLMNYLVNELNYPAKQLKEMNLTAKPEDVKKLILLTIQIENK